MAEEAGTSIPSDERTTPQPSQKTYRVKLYKLDGDGVWEDQGTGFCNYTTGDENEPDELFVQSEKDHSPLLKTKILKHKAYQRQQDTLIVWTEDASHDLALSFQDIDGCEEIWRRIRDKVDDDDEEKPTNTVNAASSDSGSSTAPMTEPDTNDTPIIPLPEISNLSEIVKILSEAKTMQMKDMLATFIIHENYIEKLLPVFESCEDLESIEDLHKLYTIMKSIILLNDNTIIEYIVRDDIILGVAGILEYNPATPNMKAKHRQALEKCSKIQPVVPINDDSTVQKVHQNFRLRYLKDVILVDSLDESLASILQSLIFFNHIDIINSIQQNREFLTELFRVFKSEESSETTKKDTVKFALQLCTIAKSLQASSRVSLYRTLASYGMIDMFAFGLTNSEEDLRIATVNVVASIVDLDTSVIRGHMLEQMKNKPREETLLGTIIDRFTMDDDAGLKIQYIEILKVLLELSSAPMLGAPINSEMMRRNDPDTDEFLTTFYDSYASMLLRPIENLENKPMKLDGPIEPLVLSPDHSEVILHLCDFLTFSVRQHGFRSKYMVLATDCFTKVAQLYRCRESHMKLAALRFFRACVGQLDEFYNKNLIKFNIFEPTVRVFLDTDGRNNLLNSACLELLEFIRKENVKILIHHLITRFGSVLDTITYVSTCKMLRRRYEQAREAEEDECKDKDDKEKKQREEEESAKRGWSSSTVDEDEEEYFNQSDEEDDMTKPQNSSISNAQKPPITPLVDYADEDEEGQAESKSEDNAADSSKAKSSKSPAPSDSSPEAEEAPSKSITADSGPPPEPAAESDSSSQKSIDMEVEPEPDVPKSPPPIPKRRRDDDEDEDDVLAARAERNKRQQTSPLGSPKKIIINPQIKQLRSNK